MIDEKMERLLNEQINKEVFSEYLYLSMAAYFESRTLKGFAHWMRKQAEEEHEHAMKIFDYVLERGGKVQLAAIGAPKLLWKDAEEAIKDAYEHEKTVTASIHRIAESAAAGKDKATEVFLNWFIEEQVEEEAQADEILQKVKMTSGGGLLVLDHHLGKRE